MKDPRGVTSPPTLGGGARPLSPPALEGRGPTDVSSHPGGGAQPLPPPTLRLPLAGDPGLLGSGGRRGAEKGEGSIPHSPSPDSATVPDFLTLSKPRSTAPPDTPSPSGTLPFLEGPVPTLISFLSRTQPGLSTSCRGTFRSPWLLGLDDVAPPSVPLPSPRGRKKPDRTDWLRPEERQRSSLSDLILPRNSRMLSPKSDPANGASEDSLQLDIQKLKEKRDMLDKEISQLLSEGYSVDELEDHILQLHEYNEIKDVGQMLLGKLAVIRGVTTKDLYPEFGLDMDD
ncbi:DNA repair protein SWI5 homolog [Tamandua tetradactyla]|uniref:DNA repair protein SWI5 homolog n=1 Tax=Tamandua tetradactyla TaxID=48850 RepID=UPI00405402DD